MPSSVRPPKGPVGFERLAAHLRRHILSGQIGDGERLPSFTELQAEFGAATSTINRALIALEQEGLIKRERRRGVFATPAGRITRRRSGIIGVSGSAFLSSESLAYWSRLLHGIREAAHRAGLEVLLVATTPSAEGEKADGFVFCDWSAQIIRPLVPPGVPAVALLAPAAGIASVTADDCQGARLATEHLVALGHRRIAYMPGVGAFGRPDENEVVARRHAGYLAGLAAANVAPQGEWVRNLGGYYDRPPGPASNDDFVSSGRDSMQGWLEADWQDTGCTAILAHNDQVAIGIIEALAARGLTVPHDVSVVGFDGAESYRYYHPQLTTVELPLEKIGALAVEALLPQLAADLANTTGGVATNQIVEVKLRVGESTAPCRS